MTESSRSEGNGRPAVRLRIGKIWLLTVVPARIIGVYDCALGSRLTGRQMVGVPATRSFWQCLVTMLQRIVRPTRVTRLSPPRKSSQALAEISVPR
jgi:hypothetical protein